MWRTVQSLQAIRNHCQEPIALKAIPKCNITDIDGADMKQAMSGYLEVLYEQNPESIGAALLGMTFITFHRNKRMYA